MSATEQPGFIEPGRLYTVTEVRQRLGLGELAWRELRREGLPVTYLGRRAFVFADDLIAALRRTAEITA